MMSHTSDDDTSDSSVVLEGTPVKEQRFNKTFVNRAGGKNRSPEYNTTPEQEESSLRSKVKDVSLSNASFTQEKNLLGENKSKELLKTNSSSIQKLSPSQNDKTKSIEKPCLSSDDEEENIEETYADASKPESTFDAESNMKRHGNRNHRKCYVQSSDSEISKTEKGLEADVSKKSLCKQKEICQYRKGRKVILSSDSDESLTSKANNYEEKISSDSEENSHQKTKSRQVKINSVNNTTDYREKVDSSDSDSEENLLQQRKIRFEQQRAYLNNTTEYRGNTNVIDSSDDSSSDEEKDIIYISDEFSVQSPNAKNTVKDKVLITEVVSDKEKEKCDLNSRNSTSRDESVQIVEESTLPIVDSKTREEVTRKSTPTKHDKPRFVDDPNFLSKKSTTPTKHDKPRFVDDPNFLSKKSTTPKKHDKPRFVDDPNFLSELHHKPGGVGYEEDFQPKTWSTPKPSIVKPTKLESRKQSLQVLEESLQLVTISENKSQPVTNIQSEVSEKRLLQANIVAVKKEIDKLRMILRCTNLANLPDRGTRLQMSLTQNEIKLKRLQEQFQSSNFVAVPDAAELLKTQAISDKKVESNANLGKGPGSTVSKKEIYGSMPSTYGMGKKALETHRAEKAMTVDTLKHLHGSLKSCPGEDVTAEDPKSLKSNVELMPHQKRALAWLIWREGHKPNGGILADDMGLGKTLTMISLILKMKEETENKCLDERESESESDDDSDGSWMRKKRTYEKGGTLVVCPASLLSQWEGEVKRRVKRGVIETEIYHGSSRESRPRRLARLDMVITTYNIVRSEGGVKTVKGGSAVDPSNQGTLFGVKWERIILDEAHTIRNHKSQTSVAVCALKARYRWALTGTPVHNKELDLYALLKFLRCSPFDDLIVWRRWVDNKSAGGMQRLNTVINSLMLRRTKEQLQSLGTLSCLPQKEIFDITVKLDEDEFKVYETVMNFSKTLFAQFLAQKVEKEQMFQGRYGESSKPSYLQNGNADVYALNPDLKAMKDKLNSMGDIKSFHILVLLLRLRQICCHPGLIEGMLDKENCVNDGIEDEDGLDVDLLSQISRMGLDEKEETKTLDSDGMVKKKILVPSNPVFKRERISSKMRLVFEKLQEEVFSKGDNAVVVSQFTSMLELIHQHLRENGVKCLILTGSVPVKERMTLVEQFNGPSKRPMVLLLSLTAGGVGLNLIGGNHLLLMDPHWNPQLEAQAFDRIYRVGQKKAVCIYKFTSEETIEQQIKCLQARKLALASNILTGAKHYGGNKLSLDDLKLLFNFQNPT